jgi:hypothetical protein
MGRLPLLVGLLLICCVLPAASAHGSDGDAGAAPTLRVVGLYPLTVYGANFRGAELVKLTARAQTTVVRTVQASARGRFTAQMRLRVPRCGTATVRAIGSRGSRAVGQLPGPHCVNPLERGKARPLLQPGN